MDLGSEEVTNSALRIFLLIFVKNITQSYHNCKSEQRKMYIKDLIRTQSKN